MILAPIATFFCIIAILCTLLTAATLGFYFGRVPGGADAMGLVIPFFIGLLAGVSGFFAALAAAARGGLDGLQISRGAACGVMATAAVLVGFSIMGAFTAWAERYRFNQPPLLMVTGVLLPVAFQCFVIFAAWNDSRSTAGVAGLKVFGSVALLAAATGLITVGLMLEAYIRQQRVIHAAIREEMAVKQAEEDRRNALTPEQRLLEDLEKYSPDSPLWTLTVGLSYEKSPSLRRIWIERALKVPNFNNDLRSNLSSNYGNYRHGCSVFLAEVAEEALQRDTWAPMLAKDAELTAADILKHQDLGVHDDDNLAQHVQTIARAAQRLTMTPELKSSLEALLTAVRATPAGPDREACEKALR